MMSGALQHQGPSSIAASVDLYRETDSEDSYSHSGIPLSDLREGDSPHFPRPAYLDRTPSHTTYAPPTSFFDDRIVSAHQSSPLYASSRRSMRSPAGSQQTLKRIRSMEGVGRKSERLTDLAEFLWTKQPPKSSWTSTPESAPKEEKKSPLRFFRRSSSKKPQVLQLPDAAVATRTKNGQWYIAITPPGGDRFDLGGNMIKRQLQSDTASIKTVNTLPASSIFATRVGEGFKKRPGSIRSAKLGLGKRSALEKEQGRGSRSRSSTVSTMASMNSEATITERGYYRQSVYRDAPAVPPIPEHLLTQAMSDTSAYARMAPLQQKNRSAAAILDEYKKLRGITRPARYLYDERAGIPEPAFDTVPISSHPTSSIISDEVTNAPETEQTVFPTHETNKPPADIDSVPKIPSSSVTDLNEISNHHDASEPIPETAQQDVLNSRSPESNNMTHAIETAQTYWSPMAFASMTSTSKNIPDPGEIEVPQNNSHPSEEASPSLPVHGSDSDIKEAVPETVQTYWSPMDFTSMLSAAPITVETSPMTNSGPVNNTAQSPEVLEPTYCSPKSFASAPASKSTPDLTIVTSPARDNDLSSARPEQNKWLPNGSIKSQGSNNATDSSPVITSEPKTIPSSTIDEDMYWSPMKFASILAPKTSVNPITVDTKISVSSAQVDNPPQAVPETTYWLPKNSRSMAPSANSAVSDFAKSSSFQGGSGSSADAVSPSSQVFTSESDKTISRRSSFVSMRSDRKARVKAKVQRDLNEQTTPRDNFAEPPPSFSQVPRRNHPNVATDSASRYPPHASKAQEEELEDLIQFQHELQGLVFDNYSYLPLIIAQPPLDIKETSLAPAVVNNHTPTIEKSSAPAAEAKAAQCIKQVSAPAVKTQPVPIIPKSSARAVEVQAAPIVKPTSVPAVVIQAAPIIAPIIAQRPKTATTPTITQPPQARAPPPAPTTAVKEKEKGDETIAELQARLRKMEESNRMMMETLNSVVGMGSGFRELTQLLTNGPVVEAGKERGDRVGGKGKGKGRAL